MTAIDFSLEMLRKAEAKDIDAEFRLADVCNNDLSQTGFDVVLCFHSFPLGIETESKRGRS